MKSNDLIEIQRCETITYGSTVRKEMYYFSWKGNYCEDAFTFDEILAIHELTGRMITEHKEKEATDGQK